MLYTVFIILLFNSGIVFTGGDDYGEFQVDSRKKNNSLIYATARWPGRAKGATSGAGGGATPPTGGTLRRAAYGILGPRAARTPK